MNLKKGWILLLTGIFILSASGCAAKKAAPSDTADEAIGSALDILNQIWDTYTEEERFPAAGGDYEHSVMDAPGVFDISDTDSLEILLYVPQEAAALIDDAALLMHMMNANTFTAGAFHIADTAKVKAFSEALEENIQNTQWMCGFPDRLLIVSIGDSYVLSAFGNEELMSIFQEKLLSCFEDADILFDEVIAESSEGV
jgi:hypothetical protein